MIISHENFPVGELEMLINTDKRIIVLQNGPLYVTLEQSEKPWIDCYPDSTSTAKVKRTFYRYLCDIWEIKGVSWHGPQNMRPVEINHIMDIASQGQFTPRSPREFAALAIAHGSELETKSDETGLQSKN